MPALPDGHRRIGESKARQNDRKQNKPKTATARPEPH
jgi:hypothetical protein